MHAYVERDERPLVRRARAPVATDATAEEMFETGGARKPSGLLASVGMGEHL